MTLAGGGMAPAPATAPPVDVAALLARRPDAATLEAAQAQLVGWLRAHPERLPQHKQDIEALDVALSRARQDAREREDDARKRLAHEVSETLRGLPGEDAFAAHAALKPLTDAVARAGAPARPRVTVPEPIPGLRARLRSYQREGVEFLLACDLNAIVADEMGLGKTVTAIAAVLAADERALVVAPANVLYNWSDEIERFTDESPAIYHEGELWGERDARFLLTTYDALKGLDASLARAADRPVLLLDEAHYLRNPRTLRAQLVTKLPQKRRILLTGTPMVNRLEDYHALLRQVEPKRWGRRADFRNEWLVDPALYNEHAQVREATAMLLQRAARDVLLRRLKEDVLADLPPRIIRVRRHDLRPHQRAAHNRLLANAQRAVAGADDDARAFSALHELRQHLVRARVRPALERARELLERGEHLIVYSHYLDPLERLQDALGEDAATIVGATPPEERQEIARAFGEPGGPRVLLAQMQAGGVGLNLTAARHVLFLHLDWTPAAHAQAMDRVHRIGQDRPVLVEFMVTPDTVDERLADILLRKEDDHNLVLDEEADTLNRDQLAALLD